MSCKKTPLTEAELKEKYREYIRKFADEIENLTSLRRVYTYAQGKWLLEDEQNERKVE